jgi:hypothetical protein
LLLANTSTVPSATARLSASATGSRWKRPLTRAACERSETSLPKVCVAPRSGSLDKGRLPVSIAPPNLTGFTFTTTTLALFNQGATAWRERFFAAMHNRPLVGLIKAHI